MAGETIHPAVSADGEYVVFQRPDRGRGSTIDVVRVADGKVFAFPSGFAGTTSVRARWVGNTHTLAFRGLDATGRMTIYAQDFEPGVDTTATRRQLIATESDSVAETFAISPDGTRAVISVVDEASGLMIAEGVELD
jgi:Tol biopolymer transport system component